MRFLCPHCSRKYKSDDRFAGALMVCQRCGQEFYVPTLAESESAISPAAPPESPLEPQSVAAQEAAAQGDGEELAPWRSRRERGAEEEMDLTPMVDMTFLLLIFFMVTASYQLQKAIDIPSPDAVEEATSAQSISELENDDSYVVVKIYSDDRTWVEESEAPTWHDLVGKIMEERSQSRGGVTPNKLLVMASGEARHQTVVQALDAGTAAGMAGVRLAPLEDDVP